MEQINSHRVSLSHRIARGLAHGLISYGQNHKVISRFTFRLPGHQKTQGLSSTTSGNPKTRNVKSAQKSFRHSGYREFKRQGSHSSTASGIAETRNMKIHFGIPATGISKDKGLSLPLHRETPKHEM
jgi:hypothetical protein